MIIGHENDTYELSKDEINLAIKLIPHFKNRSKSNPVKAKEIVTGVNLVYKLTTKFSEVRLRKIVNYYRVNSILPIISTCKGYYVSYDPEDINEMIKSLNQRAKSILDCSEGLKVFL
jgi:hypothetical protein